MKNFNQFAKFIFTQALLAVIGINCFSQNYEIDPSFNVGTGFSSDADSAAYGIEIQADNKILVLGNFHSFDGTPMNKLVRLNSDGSIDPTFIIGTGFVDYGPVVMKVQTDGKIIVAGYFDEYNNVLAKGIVRLHPNGALDTTFNYNGFGFNYSQVEKIILHDDGKIVVIGVFNGYNGSIARKIVRLNSDGSIDTSFDSNLGFCDNSVLFDIDFHTNKYVVSGYLNTYNGDSIFNIVLLNYDGSIDASFNSGFLSPQYVYMSKFTSDGKILIGGEFAEYGGQALNSFIRLNQDGTVDTTFDAQWLNISETSKVWFAEDGKLWVLANSSYSGNTRWLNRINEDGSQDPSFDPDAYFGEEIPIDMKFLTDGKLLICGRISAFNGSTIHGIVRLQNILSVDSNPNINENLSIYPNPATASVNVNSKNISKSEIQLFDAFGRRMNCSITINNVDNISVNTESLSSGVYTVRIIGQNTQTTRIMIQY